MVVVVVVATGAKALHQLSHVSAGERQCSEPEPWA